MLPGLAIGYIAIFILHQQVDAVVNLSVHVGQYFVDGGVDGPGPLVLVVLGMLGDALGAQGHQAMLYLSGEGTILAEIGDQLVPVVDAVGLHPTK